MDLNKVYILSLDKSQEYINTLQEKFVYCNFPPTQVELTPGVDGKEYCNTPDKVFELGYKLYPNYDLGNKTDPQLFWHRQPTVGEIGCALSHIEAWSEFYKSENDNALFLEYDFRPEIKNINWSVFDEIKDYSYDILYLGKKNYQSEDKEIGFNHFVEPGFAYQMHSYILTRSGVEKLFKYHLPTFRNNLIPIDEFIPATIGTHPRKDIQDMYKDNLLTAISVRGNLFTQDNYEIAGNSLTMPVKGYDY